VVCTGYAGVPAIMLSMILSALIAVLQSGSVLMLDLFKSSVLLLSANIARV
jgi:hypothetical protein